MDANSEYILIVFNTCTQKYEEVTVSAEVYRTYNRTNWNIRDNNDSFFAHEIQLSSLIGAQDCGYENFHEFIDAVNTPENIILKPLEKKTLYHAISTLSVADQALVQGIFFEGQGEVEYSKKLGISQPAVHKQKVRILRYLKKVLEK